MLSKVQPSLEAAMPLAGPTEPVRIQDALVKSDGNKSRAAQLLGISRQTLYKKLRVLGLSM
jgi:transcriptional regulator of acetoin/glycerol metabolism